MGSARAAVHRTIVVVDVEGFGDLRRTNPHKVAVRDGLYAALQAAFAAASVPWASCDHFDQGDAIFVLAPPEVPKAPFVESVPAALAVALREHNDTHPEQERIRARMVVHAGEITYDSHGLTSNAVNHAFRLLDAGPLKAALADSPGTLALIASSWFFDEVVRHSTVIDPATFRPIRVVVKETSAVGWIALVDHPYPPDPALLESPVGGMPDATAPPVDEHLRLLATASWNQWTAAANDRRLVHPAPLPIRWRLSTEPVAGPVSAAAYTRFDPLPGLTAVNGSGLCAGDREALHRIYGGLPSGRLLLIGPAGSGKSAAAILLLLDALRYREQATAEDQAQIPVPVLFTLHGWDPDGGESVTDWMVSKLAETYPMFRSRDGRRAAADLLAARRVAGFLDGLDEIPESVRPGVLAALADAPFRLVLLTRTEEAVAAANHGPLAGAIALQLQPVEPTDAATYLLHTLVTPPPAPWKTICDHLAGEAVDRRRTSAVSEALNNPLALSLLRDVYGPTGQVDELLDGSRFRTAADVENHLLDHAITAAYTPRPGRPRPCYTVATAHRTLRYLATRLTEERTSDLAWWRIPTWTPHRPRMITAVVTNILVNGLTVGLPLGLVFGLTVGLSVGLTVGPMTLLGLMGRRWRGVASMPGRITRFAYRITLRSLVFGLMAGLLGGLLAGLTSGHVFGLSTGLLSGFEVGLASGLAGVALGGCARHMEVDGSSLGPADVWRHDRNAGLVYISVSLLAVGLLAGLASGLVPGLASGLASRPSVVLSVVLPVGLAWGLMTTLMVRLLGVAASSPGGAALETALAAVRLTIRHKTPLGLIAFLEDARSRHLLRTVGPVYQFRHAKLQERLAQPTAKNLSRIETEIRH